MKKVLLLGESWDISTTHTKGIDSVVLGTYVEYGDALIGALRSSGIDVLYMPGHIARLKFPFKVEELEEYSVIIISDVGSNTFLLHPDTQNKCIKLPNRLNVLKDYVLLGGGLLTCGGYMCYSGIDGKARYGMTPLADAIAVNMLNYDDRMEHPEGVYPVIVKPEHPVLKDIDNENWPYFLGYNKVSAKAQAQLLATIEGDTFMACMEYGNGRSFAFASDCVPHWGPPAFVSWKYYPILFGNIVRWLAKEI